jgi:hypothetical protein
VDELADSASLISDPAGLRRRLVDDGYLFFRGLLPAGEVRAAGLTVLARLRSGGRVDDRDIPSIQPHAVNSMDALADPAYRAEPGDVILFHCLTPHAALPNTRVGAADLG